MNIFISYSRIDAQDLAESLHDFLKDLGYKVFMDLRGIQIGENEIGLNNSV